ncbi:hypothetical protein GGR52DRAFT_531476 [Hypoxylon sp. FL1284]|nr:hypothetical protein GGR52DRAFT_531476 [Hypoxylon sp. FL1284]
MATLAPICRGCAHRILLSRSSLQTFKPSSQHATGLRWRQPTFARLTGRLYATAKANAAPPPKQTPRAPGTSKPTAARSVQNLQVPLLSYAQELAQRTNGTTLYEAEPKRIFLFSSYLAGFVCATAAGVNIWFNAFNAPEGTPQIAMVGMGLVGVVMAAFGTRFALMPAGAVRSIRVLPAREVKALGSAGRPVSPLAKPVRLEIEARRNVPLPFVPLLRIQADPSEVVMKVPMFNPRVAPTEEEKMFMEQEEKARRKAARQYDMDHLMTAPFRHAGQTFSQVLSALRRGLTGEGFAPVEIAGSKYKLDITSAYVLEEGRAMDRILKIEDDRRITRFAPGQKQ